MPLGRLPIAILVTLAISAVSPVIAEEVKQKAPLSLQDCVKVALANQNDIILGRDAVIISKQKETQAKSSYFPQVGVQNNAFVTGSKGVLTQSRTGTALTATQNIYDGGLREANVRGAKYGVKQNEFGLTRTVQTVVFSVTQAYYEVLRSKHLAEVAETNVKYNEGLRGLIQTRVELGDAAQSDVLPVEAQLANSQVSLLSAQNTVRTTAIALQNSMGLAPQSGFDVQEVAEHPNAKIEPVDTYMSDALANRPDIGQAEAGIGSSKASVRSSRIVLFPRPVITGQYQKGIGGLSGSSSQIAGGFTFDLFDGNANRAAYKAALTAKADAEQRNSQLGKDIQAQVQTAYLNLTDADNRLKASQVGLDAAQKNYDVQNERYKQGLGIPLDLLNAELQVVTAQTNLVQARYDYYIALAQMEYSVGKQGGTDAG